MPIGIASGWKVKDEFKDWAGHDYLIAKRLQAQPAADTAEAIAFLARTSGLDPVHTKAYKDLINGLVGDGVFAKLDALWVFATQDGVTAKINLVSASFAITNISDADFIADHGYAPIFPNFGQVTSVPFGTGGLNFAQTSAHISLWSLTSGQSDSYDIQDDNAVFVLRARNTSDQCSPNLACNPVNIPNTDGSGFLLATRNASTVEVLRNDVSLGTASPSNRSLVDGNTIYVPNSGSHQMAMASFGGDLGSLHTQFYSRLRTFMSAVGLP